MNLSHGKLGDKLLESRQHCPDHFDAAILDKSKGSLDGQRFHAIADGEEILDVLHQLLTQSFYDDDDASDVGGEVAPNKVEIGRIARIADDELLDAQRRNDVRKQAVKTPSCRTKTAAVS